MIYDKRKKSPGSCSGFFLRFRTGMLERFPARTYITCHRKEVMSEVSDISK